MRQDGPQFGLKACRCLLSIRDRVWSPSSPTASPVSRALYPWPARPPPSVFIRLRRRYAMEGLQFSPLRQQDRGSLTAGDAMEFLYPMAGIIRELLRIR